MPPGGAGVRAEQIATLTRLRHVRLRSDELGELLDRAEAGLDSAPRDSFEASLVRVSRREWEQGAPRARRAASRDRAGDLTRRARLGGRTRTRRLRRLPPAPRARDRAQASLHRVLRRRAPVRPAARRLRARDAHRGARARADASPRRHGRAAVGDHEPTAERRRVVPLRRLPGRTAGRARATDHGAPAAPAGDLADRRDRAPVRDRDRDLGPADHDSLRTRLRGHLALGRDPRGRTRDLPERDRGGARAHPPVPLGLARLRRVAEPALGELGRTRAARSSPTSTRCSPSSSRSASPAPIARRSTGPRTAFSRR